MGEVSSEKDDTIHGEWGAGFVACSDKYFLTSGVKGDGLGVCPIVGGILSSEPPILQKNCLFLASSISTLTFVFLILFPTTYLSRK